MTLFLMVTLLIIGADLYFSYSSDICLRQQILFQSINVGKLLEKNSWFNLIGLIIIGFAIKNDYTFLMKSVTKIMMILYDVTSFLLCTVLIYNYIYSNNCSSMLFRYMVVRISGSIFPLLLKIINMLIYNFIYVLFCILIIYNYKYFI